MDIIIKIIQFFLCFTILVGIHELGHFLMARVFKIRVDKFYIFFDPWFSLFKFKRGDTEYGLGWLPLGGYCKIAGMIDESMDKEQMKLPPKPDEFRTKPAWQRFLVMIAGVVMNVLLAIFIYIGICYTWGDNYFSNEDARWGYTFNEAGRKLGFQDGDRIVSIDGEAVDNVNKIVNALIITEGERRVVVEREGRQVELTLPLGELIEMRQNKGYEDLLALRMPFLIDSAVYETASALRRGDEIVAINDAQGLEYPAYREYLKAHAGEDVTLTVKREGDMLLELVVPVSDEGRLGVTALNPYKLRTQKYTFWQAIPAGISKAGKVMSSYWEQLKMIVQPKTKMYKELGGFIAIGSIFPGDWNWEDFWMKTAFLSIILAVMNILPIPGLDGGHAIFTFWEMITGRKVSDNAEPNVPDLPEEWASIADGGLARAVGAVVHAADKGSNNPVLSAVRVRGSDGSIELSATNRYVAATARADGSADMDALVPAAWLKANAEGADRIGATGRMFAIAGPVYTDATPMVEGQKI